MKKAVLLGGVLMVWVLCAGCAMVPTALGPSGAGFGSFGTSVAYPALNTSSTQYQISSADFTILGPVHGEGSSLSVLGLVAAGDSGYGHAMAQAREMGADEVMNVRVDTRYFNVLFFFSKVDTVITGTGIKWKRTQNVFEKPESK